MTHFAEFDDEEDYQSDQCDAGIADELFMSAFFNQNTTPLKSSDLSLLSAGFSSPNDAGNVSTKFEAVKQETLIDSVESEEATIEHILSVVRNIGSLTKTENFLPSKDISIDDSEDEGIAAKLKEANRTGPKQPKESVSEKPCKRSLQDDDSSDDDQEDINAVIERNNTRKGRKPKVQKKKKKPKIEPTKDESECSLELPTYSSEVSSEDEMILSDIDPSFSMNVVSSNRRGVEDKISLTPWASKKEHERLWYIDDEDRYANFRKRDRYNHWRECRNCRRSGHREVACPEPKKSTCIFCGGNNHFIRKCPNKICRICKGVGHMSNDCFHADRLLRTRCYVCNSHGHLHLVCPDYWRRYHNTTVEGPPIEPESVDILAMNRRFCSWCGLTGHFASDCRKAFGEGLGSLETHNYDEPDTPDQGFKRKRRRQKKNKKEADSVENVYAAKRQKKNNKDNQPFESGQDFIAIEPTRSSVVQPTIRRSVVQPSTSNRNPFESGNDFVSLQGPSGSRMQPTKKKQIVSSFAQSVLNRNNKKATNDNIGGIDSMPSVQKRIRHRKRNKAAQQSEPEVETIRNSRKERRFLKRMQYRIERDALKREKQKRKQRSKT